MSYRHAVVVSVEFVCPGFFICLLLTFVRQFWISIDIYP